MTSFAILQAAIVSQQVYEDISAPVVHSVFRDITGTLTYTRNSYFIPILGSPNGFYIVQRPRIRATVITQVNHIFFRFDKNNCVNLIVIILLDMPEHGDYDSGSRKWYCGYWQSLKEWEDIHDYDPSSPSTENIDNAFNSDTGDKPEN